jgi:hypothetical protein
MNDHVQEEPGTEMPKKATRTSENFSSPMNLKKKTSKTRGPLGGFYTPGNLKSHHYMNKHRDSGTNRENGR